MVKNRKGNGFGIAGFVLGLVSVLMFGMGFVLAVLGLIFSIIQLKRNKNGLAIAGLVLSIIGLFGLLFIIATTIIWSATVPLLKDSISEGSDCLDAVASISLDSSSENTCRVRDMVRLTINRGISENYNLSDINVVFSSSGEEYSIDLVGEGVYSSSALPSIGQSGDYILSSSDVKGLDSFESIDKIEVVPILKGNVVCDISSSVILQDC